MYIYNYVYNKKEFTYSPWSGDDAEDGSNARAIPAGWGSPSTRAGEGATSGPSRGSSTSGDLPHTQHSNFRPAEID